MYNRYIPQGDGTYRRSRVQEPTRPSAAPGNTPTVPPTSPSAADTPPETSAPPPPPRSSGQPPHQENRRDPQNTNISGFLKQILPQNFDTGDLFVVLLLLLMSENRKDNTALLTLVIYLFL